MTWLLQTFGYNMPICEVRFVFPYAPLTQLRICIQVHTPLTTDRNLGQNQRLLYSLDCTIKLFKLFIFLGTNFGEPASSRSSRVPW